MGHNTVNGSVENTAQVNDQWHMSDGAALLYLTGHPPAPGEPCWRAW
jgi:hypothetical protein